jgi:hypothetical protein
VVAEASKTEHSVGAQRNIDVIDVEGAEPWAVDGPGTEVANIPAWQMTWYERPESSRFRMVFLN